MDQKNTIVKCKAHPNCLFNHNGVCDNYVINIGADGKCEGYLETEVLEYLIRDPVKTGLAFKKIFRQMDLYRKDICRSCKYDPHGNLCDRKNVTSNGIWTCYEEAKK